MTSPRFIRRARPGLGTLVEVGLRAPDGLDESAALGWADGVARAAWEAVARVERAMSIFDPGSDAWRFNQAPSGATIDVGEETAVVLRWARTLAHDSGGRFDVSQGTGADAWSLVRQPGGARLHKRSGTVRLDLGGIAKGHAVDRAFEALALRLDTDPEAAWWVNAGGDLRVHGWEIPIHLRDEFAGGARPWVGLRHGALATSHFGPGARSQLSGAGGGARHVSVVSPRCLWSDALTKVVALSSRADEPLLQRYHATAWIHPAKVP